MIYSILDFGARSGASSSTQAIQAALDAAKNNGGGEVIIPPGLWLSGTLNLSSHLVLRLQAGAVLKASPNFSEFGEVPDLAGGRHSLLRAVDTENLVITGGGTIDGNIRAWSPNYDETPAYTWKGLKSNRPTPLNDFYKCRNLRIENINIVDTPGWTSRFWMCDEIFLSGLKVRSDVFSGNSDGFDFVGCRDVMVTNCLVETGDDAFVFKCVKGTRSCERATITNCIIRTSCAAFRLGAETHHPYRNFVFSNSVVHRSCRAVDIVSMNGAVIEDVAVSNLVIDTDSSITMSRPIHLEVRKGRSEWAIVDLPLEEQTVGVIRGVTISNIQLRTDGRILLTATDGGRLERISLSDIQMDYRWIEDPEYVMDLSDPMQSSNYCPEARHARGAITVMNADQFRVSNLMIDWPRPEKSLVWTPKHEHGQLVCDPSRHPSAAYHALWCKNVTRGVIDGALLDASDPSLAAIHKEDCDLLIR